ncbi:hypothetical protein SAMN05444339_1239 [Loktanella atrilutea]|uniref:Uncharacterized protein n=1 Tax=Loktanella atrilutea TaxID=366533 RepID=A0A1M5FNM9_LOKAT|nr:hypothetical protein [Loktanella atrilutea]SHF93140.1 hypothetical protein SAMN05444339_1239 [Loktanella atrilutea]
MTRTLNVSSVAALVLAGSVWASAQSPDYMREDCMVASHGFYQAVDARSETTYEGQRTDGTHAVKGLIYPENRVSDFQHFDDETSPFHFFRDHRATR